MGWSLTLENRHLNTTSEFVNSYRLQILEGIIFVLFQEIQVNLLNPAQVDTLSSKVWSVWRVWQGITSSHYSFVYKFLKAEDIISSDYFGPSNNITSDWAHNTCRGILEATNLVRAINAASWKNNNRAYNHRQVFGHFLGYKVYLVEAFERYFLCQDHYNIYL